MELMARSMCVVRLVKGTEEEARSISWKQQQEAEAVAPPTPPKPSPHQRLDPTSASPRFRARARRTPKISDTAQGIEEPKEPPLTI
jgi:glycogen operon protein